MNATEVLEAIRAQNLSLREMVTLAKDLPPDEKANQPVWDAVQNEINDVSGKTADEAELLALRELSGKPELWTNVLLRACLYGPGERDIQKIIALLAYAEEIDPEDSFDNWEPVTEATFTVEQLLALKQAFPKNWYPYLYLVCHEETTLRQKTEVFVEYGKVVCDGDPADADEPEAVLLHDAYVDRDVWKNPGLSHEELRALGNLSEYVSVWRLLVAYGLLPKDEARDLSIKFCFWGAYLSGYAVGAEEGVALAEELGNEVLCRVLLCGQWVKVTDEQKARVLKVSPAAAAVVR